MNEEPASTVQPIKAAVKRSFAASLHAIGLEPVDHFAHIFKRAWSIRLIFAAGLFSGLEIALPLIDQFVVIPRGWFAAASGLTTMAACIARLTVQSSMNKPQGPTDASE